MDFEAEIVRTSQRKLASNDNQFEVVFRTHNPMIMDLGKLPSDTTFIISVNLHSNSDNKASKQEADNVGI